MDYLISEGYPGAAEKFAQETNLYQGEAFDVEGIRERVQIRNAILTGKVEEAIELVNSVDAEVSSSLSFIPACLFMIIQVSCTTHITFRGIDETNSLLQSSV